MYKRLYKKSKPKSGEGAMAALTAEEVFEVRTARSERTVACRKAAAVRARTSEAPCVVIVGRLGSAGSSRKLVKKNVSCALLLFPANMIMLHCAPHQTPDTPTIERESSMIMPTAPAQNKDISGAPLHPSAAFEVRVRRGRGATRDATSATVRAGALIQEVGGSRAMHCRVPPVASEHSHHLIISLGGAGAMIGVKGRGGGRRRTDTSRHVARLVHVAVVVVVVARCSWAKSSTRTTTRRRRPRARGTPTSERPKREKRVTTSPRSSGSCGSRPRCEAGCWGVRVVRRGGGVVGVDAKRRRNGGSRRHLIAAACIHSSPRIIKRAPRIDRVCPADG